MIKRKTFAKFKDVYDMPDLLELQTASYKEFLQVDAPVDERKNQGLQEVFNEIFPIESPDGNMLLDRLAFLRLTFGPT